jgi:glycosyltransferase involved in cell wall biosynthesis
MSNKVLILAQTPPPYHGQSIMQQALVNIKWKWCVKKFIRLIYSKNSEDIGRFSFLKILKLLVIIIEVWSERLKGRINILFYPPASPNRIPFYRDAATLLLTRWCAGKTVFHFHAGGFDKLYNKLNGFEKLIAEKTYGKPDAAIVLTSSLQNEIKWINPKRIYIIPNGTRDHYLDDLRKIEKPGEINILTVGLLSESKGVLISLDAARILKQSGRVFKWTFLGDWQSAKFRKESEEKISKSGLEDNVFFPGSKHGKDKWKYYRGADIFCFPTFENETTPVVIFEAMMMSLPIITTNWRAIPEIVDDNVNGILVPVNDPKYLAEAIEKLIADRELRMMLGKNAREKYLREFTLEKHLARVEAVFKEISGMR